MPTYITSSVQLYEDNTQQAKPDYTFASSPTLESSTGQPQKARPDYRIGNSSLTGNFGITETNPYSSGPTINIVSSLSYQEFASDYTGSLAELQQQTCEDFIPDEIPVNVPCPSCKPDPEATVKDWTTLKDSEAFLNKRDCVYGISIETKYSNVGGLVEYPKRVSEYAPIAARRLLRYYNKLETDEIVYLMVSGSENTGPILQATDWFVPFEQNSKLKIFYTIPAFNFDGISPDTEDPSAFNQETIPSANEFALELNDLSIKLDRFTMAMSVYSKLQGALYKIDDGSFIVEQTNKQFIIGSVKDETSLMFEIFSIEKTLNKILDDYGFFAFGSFMPQIRNGTRRRANSIKFGYAEGYVLDRITIIEKGCPDVIIEGEKLIKYSDESPLNNPTIISYLSKINEIYDEIMAKNAPEWTEFLINYTYPTLTIDYGKNTIFDDEKSLAECIASGIANYGATTLNRALDAIFTIPDAVAKKLNDEMCATAGKRKSKEETLQSLFAKEQYLSFAEFAQKVREQSLKQEKDRFIDILRDLKLRMTKVSNSKIDDLYNVLFNDAQFCGILAALKAIIECVGGDFSYQQMITKIVEVSLKQLTPLQLSKLLVGLPPDKRIEVINKVDSVIKEDNLVQEFFKSFSYSISGSASVSNQAFTDQLAYEKQIESNILSAEVDLNIFQELNTATTGSEANSIWNTEELEQLKQQTEQELSIMIENLENELDIIIQKISETNVNLDRLKEILNTNIKESNDIKSQIDRWRAISDISGLETDEQAEFDELFLSYNAYIELIENIENEINQLNNLLQTYSNERSITLGKIEILLDIMPVAEFEGLSDEERQQTIIDAETLLQTSSEELENYRSQIGQNNLGEGLSKIQGILINAYINALLELIDINELYEQILKFPGVKIISKFIDAANCPKPDDESKITFLNFLKTLEVEWCRLHFDVTFPTLTIPDIGAFFSTLWKSLGKVAKETMLKLIAEIITEILNKILEILSNSFCNLLGLATQIVGARLAGQTDSTRTIVMDMLRETFGCPPIENPEQQEAMLDAVAQIFGGQSGNSFTAQEVASVLSTASTSLTAFELVDLLKGNLSSDKARYLKNVLRSTSPKFSSLFPNESSICGVFATMGNLIPDRILNDFEENARQLIDAELPANPSICGTPDSIDRFRALRESILNNKGLSSDEIKKQIDGIQNRTNENFTFLVDLASNGLNNMVGEKMAAALLGPDALQNPMAAVNQDPNCPTSIYGSPYSSAVVSNVQNLSNSSLFDSLKVSYLNDLFKEPNLFELGMRPIAFLNAVLSDKNGRDFVKHNKRTDDLLFKLYNSQEHFDDIKKLIPPVFPSQPEKNYFPNTISYRLQRTLKEASQFNDFPKQFINNTELYTLPEGKASLIGKKEDYSLMAKGLLQNYKLLYSQFLVNNTGISSDNISRLAILSIYNEENDPINIASDIEITNITSNILGSLNISGSSLEKYNIIYQSRYDLDDSIKLLKDEYMPSVLVNSPQADSFMTFMNSKISLGQYSNPIQINVDSFNNYSTRAIAYVISTLTDDEAYKFGYDYNAEKITQDDIDLDPETLSRKTENPRVIFLDHTKYGGTQDQPAVYIKPPTRTGWLGVADSILPELSCEPKIEKIINFEELQSKLNSLQTSIKDDPKLMDNPDCRELIPYVKPLSGLMAANLQVAIATTMRIYISEAILRCIPLYNKFVVSYDKVIDELYIDYIVAKMEKGLIEQGEGLLNIKTDKYYLYFLEQCVQVVSRLLLEGSITLTDVEQQAVDSINTMIRGFYFIKEKDYSKLKNSFDLLNNLRTSALTFKRVINNVVPSFKDYKDAYTRLIIELEDASQTYPQFTPYINNISNLSSQYENNSQNYDYVRQLKNELDNLLTEIVYVQRDYIATFDPILTNVFYNYTVKNGNIKIPTLKKLRKEMVLEAIRQTKIEAKVLMRKILKQEISTMSAYFAANIYTRPTITNLRKLFLDENKTLIARPSGSVGYFDVAANPSNGDNPLNQLGLTKTEEFDFVKNQDGFFILERYLKIQDRVLPITGTAIPNEIKNRPENLYNIVNVNEFKNWISSLPSDIQETEMYKLFGDLTVTGSQQTGFQITGSTLGLQYGLRLSYVPPANESGIFGNLSNAQNQTLATPLSENTILNKAYQLGQATINNVPIKNSQYIIPIVNSEIDLINDKLINFNPDSGLNKYDHDCLVKALYENEEFRFLFYYCLPLQKYMSAISVFVSETFVKLIGLEDEWSSSPRIEFDEKKLNFNKSKEACQIFFETYYNWDDTEYQNKKIKSMLNTPDLFLQQLNTYLRPIGPYIYADWRILPRRPYDEDGNDCDTLEEE